MALTAEHAPQFNGKKVLLTVADPENEGQTVELEGTAQVANAMGVLFKPKGRSSVELYELEQVEGIKFAPEKEKDLKAKLLKIVEYGNAKQHLVDRHGYTLASVNAMSEEEAFDFHKTVDHVEQDLGHVHGEKEKKAGAADSDADDADE